MNMKKIGFVLILLLSYIEAVSQSTNQKEWQVISFEESSTNQDAAINKEYSEGKPCAVIKISIPANNVEIVGDWVVKTEKSNGYWIVYVPEGAKRIRIIVDGVPETYELININKNISQIKSLCTYELTIRKAEPNRKSANLKALAMSIVPGVGLMQKGRTGEGVGYLISDVALIGGGIGLNIYGNQQKKKMNDINSTIEQYRSAKNNYDSAKTASYICYGAAAGVYVLNLARSYVACPKPNAPLQWSIAAEPVASPMGSGTNFAFNVSLCYTF